MKEKSLFRLLSLAFLLPFSLFAQNCIEVNIKPDIELVLPRCNRNNGSIVIGSVSGGIPPYSFTLNDTIVTAVGGFFDLSLGNYILVTSDARGCKDTTLIELQYNDLEEFIKPDNAFTPNDDGIHDTWRISGAGSFQQLSVKVFNRWGQEVHTNEPYDNSKAWDGKQNGVKVPEGTYYYVISVSDPCIEDYLNGSVTIIR